MSPQQLLWRDRFEALIGLVAPALDVVLAIGERASRILGAEDYDYYPVRPPGESIDLGLDRETAEQTPGSGAPVE